MSTPPEEPTWLTTTQVRMLHAEAIRLFGGTHGLRDEGLFESALARPKHLRAYGDTPTLFDLAAAYGYGLARNHAFVDGNKRTALLAVRSFLFQNGYHFEPDQVETVATMECIASGTISQETLANWIQNNALRR